MNADPVTLFSTVRLGPYTLPNRMVMAPMTRSRAGVSNTLQPLNAVYYAQRASAGLIVSEASQVSLQGVGYPFTPGIHTPEQVAGWRLVTDAVHAQGGRIFLQLWHVGRVSHPSMQEDGRLPVAPSAIAPEGEIYTLEGLKPFVTPRALETREIPDIVEQFRNGARHALAAGCDGVEIHAASGYLIDQFLRDGSNQRTDQYGGTVENRIRVLLEITTAVAEVWGAARVGIKFSPTLTFNSMFDSDPAHTFGYATRALNRFGLAYLHIVEPNPADPIPRDWLKVTTAFFRPLFKRRLIAGGGYDRNKSNAILASGGADLVAYGALFLANPDLPRRFALDAPLNQPDQATFYGGAEKGYTDYPTLAV